jgi:hypothetical protein
MFLAAGPASERRRSATKHHQLAVATLFPASVAKGAQYREEIVIWQWHERFALAHGSA